MSLRFSWSLLFSGIFIAYMIHAMYGLVSIFIPPKCSDGKNCLRSYLETKLELQLLLCTTTQKTIQRWQELSLVDKWSPFNYNSPDPYSKNVTIALPRSTRHNGTLYLYAFVTPFPKSERESWISAIQHRTTVYTVFPLTQYLVPEAETFNLLDNTKKDNAQETSAKTKKMNKDAKPIVHIAKKVRLVMLTDLLVLPSKDLPPDFGMILSLLSSDTYLPPVKFDKFTSRLRDFYEVNVTEEMYDLEFEFSPSSLGLIRMGVQFDAALETLRGLGFSSKDLDEVKGIFSDTNVYLLSVTVFIASIHLLFDFLAFKNDILYWKSRKTTVGLSSRTILWRCFSQFVVFLYLFEEKSSMLVVVPSGIASAIELWKVTKAFKISIQWTNGIPRPKFGSMSDSEKATAAHDLESMKYLSYILYPLCVVGAVYSLLYTPHRSWYSWTVQSLVNGVYAFGFLFMLPQLFVNYRLKSVAHLPWRAFMYKAFNTFIDDLFAFIITMPTAHRVACFRDDIVFLIYLYQRWLYPVDKKRLDAGGQYELEADGSDSGESSSKTKNAIRHKSVSSKKED